MMHITTPNYAIGLVLLSLGIPELIGAPNEYRPPRKYDLGNLQKLNEDTFFDFAREIHLCDQIKGTLAEYLEELYADPFSTLALENVAKLLVEKGEFGRGIEIYNYLVKMRERPTIAHTQRGLCLMRLGNLAEGLAEYEEWRPKEYDTERLSGMKEWVGQPLAGKTIYVAAEGGCPAMILSLRYLQKLGEMGAKVTLEAYEELAPLVRECCPYVDSVISTEDPINNKYDFFVGLLSLPYKLGITENRIPNQKQLIFAPEYLASKWNKNLNKEEGKKLIGISWSENSLHDNPLYDRSLLLPIRHGDFKLLSDLEEVRLVSIQTPYIHEFNRLDELKNRNLFDDFERLPNDLLEVVGLVENVDLVVTADSTVGHIAAAMGKPTKFLIPYTAPWFWFRKIDYSPFYPNAQLYWQRDPDDWGHVFRKVLTDIKCSLIAAKVTTEQQATPICTEKQNKQPVYFSSQMDRLAERIAKCDDKKELAQLALTVLVLGKPEGLLQMAERK